MAEPKEIKVRVLVDGPIDGHLCKCGEVVKYQTSALKPYIEAGVVDKNKAAVDYAISEGYEVRELGAVEETESVVEETESADEQADAGENSENETTG